MSDEAPVQAGDGSAEDGQKKPMSTPQAREQARKEEKLKDIDAQKAEGSLTVRQMTDEEKEKFLPKGGFREPRKKGGRRR